MLKFFLIDANIEIVHLCNTTSDQSFVETGKLKIYPDTSHIIPPSYIPLCFVIKNKKTAFHKI